MSDTKIAFVTGATGFVGAAVARVLHEKGYFLRLLCRPGSDRRNLVGLSDYEIVEGDLNKHDTYQQALHGCEALFHVAADYRIWVPDPETMHKTNVIGTERLMHAAIHARVPKIVYTSSVATLGVFSDGRVADEETPSSLQTMIGTYKKSKFEAEAAVRKLIEEHHLPCVIVSPSTPIGPCDVRPTPTGRMIVELAEGRMPAFVDTGLNIVHVDDVAMGHWLAFEKGKIGERYILGGTNLLFSEFLQIIAKEVNRKPPRIKLPIGPLFPLAYLTEALARLTGKEPMLTVDGLKMARKKMFFSSDKAIRELGYAPRTPEEAVHDAVVWFRADGYF